MAEYIFDTSDQYFEVATNSFYSADDICDWVKYCFSYATNLKTSELIAEAADKYLQALEAIPYSPDKIFGIQFSEILLTLRQTE